MPRRILDGEAIWASDKLARCREEFMPEYTWLYMLADPNGVFEINERVIVGKVGARRPSFTEARLHEIFTEFERVGLLFCWWVRGKKYGFWTNSEEYQPPISLKKRLANVGVVPDPKELEKFLDRIGLEMEAERKSPTKLLPESTTIIQGVIVEESTEEGDGEVCPHCTVPIRQIIPLHLWGAWVAVRNRMRKPVLDYTVTVMREKLLKWHREGHDILAIMDYSIRKAKDDFYLPGRNGNGDFGSAKTAEEVPALKSEVGPLRDRDPEVQAEFERMWDEWQGKK